MIADAQRIEDILVCPRCKALLAWQEMGPNGARRGGCRNSECELSALEPFLNVLGQPLLVDFGRSILGEDAYASANELISEDRKTRKKSLLRRVRSKLFGENKNASRLLRKMGEQLKGSAGKPRILVVGGGTVGSGASFLYDDPSIELIGTDIFPSAYTTVLADALQLPLKDGSVDGVCIQSVLEHLLDPAVAVGEIHRVLKPGGLVFSDTPFMQHVHEGAYDFSRYTLSGHRWLFRNFESVEVGVAGGAGTMLWWSLRYFVRAITGSGRLSNITGFLFIWLIAFDRFAKGRKGADAASSTYFFGRKTDAPPAQPHDMISFYNVQP